MVIATATDCELQIQPEATLCQEISWREYPDMRDGLTLAEQPCRSRPRLEFGDAYGIDCERISQKFSHKGFGAMMGHGLPLSACLEIFHGWIATLAKPAAFDGPYEAGATEIVEGPLGRTTE